MHAAPPPPQLPPPFRQLHSIFRDWLLFLLLLCPQVEDFLGLEHQITRDRFTLNRTRGFFCFRSADTEHCLAEGKGRPHPDIDPYTLKKLIEFFTPFNEKLFDRVGRRIHWRHWSWKSAKTLPWAWLWDNRVYQKKKTPQKKQPKKEKKDWNSLIQCGLHSWQQESFSCFTKWVNCLSFTCTIVPLKVDPLQWQVSRKCYLL